MIELAKWKTGRIDEPWKCAVVLKNRERAIDCINALGTILFAGAYPSAAPTDFVAQCDVIAKLSGEQIAEQLKTYWRITEREIEASKDLVA